MMSDSVDAVVDDVGEGDAQEMEFFMEDVRASARGCLTEMDFGRYRSLTTLRIVKQRGVTSLVGLEACATLKVLFVAECALRTLDGCETCTGLEALYVYGNAIESLRALNTDGLQRLHTLWVNDNKLSNLDGCERCSALTELNAARNGIVYVPDVGSFYNLKHLNVAGNPIQSWSAIKIASRVLSLTLKDDVHGACSVTRSKWYRSYAVVAMPNLEMLDGKSIDEDERERARNEHGNRRLAYNARCAYVRHIYRKGHARAREHLHKATHGIEAELLRARATDCVDDITSILQRIVALERTFEMCEINAQKIMTTLMRQSFRDSELVSETLSESRFAFATAEWDHTMSIDSLAAEFDSFVKNYEEIVTNCGLPATVYTRQLSDVLITANIKTVNLHDIGLIDVPIDLCACTNLHALMLGNNRVKRLTNFPRLDSLRVLDLGHNRLWKSADLNVLSSQVPHLTWLCLRGNRQWLAHPKFYTSIVLKRLDKLRTLDGIVIDEDLRMSSRLKYTTLTVDAVNRRGRTFPPSTGSEKVTELVLINESIRETPDLVQFQALRVVDLAHNSLRSLKGFNCLRELRHLSIEGNSTVRLDGLSMLKELRWLNIRGCGLSKLSITSFKTLSKLAVLNMEDNNITSLCALAQCVSLRELHVGGNMLHDIGAITALSSIATLRILSTYGNSMCDAKSYCYYVIFKLPQLEILDTDYIDDRARLSAMKMYTGRLTEDMLNATNDVPAYKVNLSSLALVHLDHAITRSRFMNVKHLKLEHNNLVDVSVLGSLPHLARLHLKNNKINASFGRTNQFKALIFLDLSGNYISSLSVLALSCCSTLRTLVLCDNFLTRLDGLNRIKALRVCIVDGNKLSRIESNTFDGCVNLKVLSLRRNAFRTLKHLSNLDSIRELKLDDNRIIDIEEISWLACLPRLKALSLIGNKIVSECDRYFEFVTACCGGLSILDGKSLSPSQIAQ